MSQRVLITGTSSGIGLSTALRLAAGGWDVVATLRNLDKREALESAAAEKGVSFEVRELDVADPASIARCVEGVQSDLGTIDALVNNAGFGRLGSVEQLDDAAVRHVMDTNFFGVWNTTRAVLPAMRKQGKGRIVTVTSIGGLVGQPFNEAYCAAKFAVEGMMEGLAPLGQALGIHVSMVEPGPVHTEFVPNTQALSADLISNGAEGYEQLIANYSKAIGGVFAEYGQSADDIAEIIDQILHDDSPHLRYVTSDFARATATPKYGDLTGDSVVERFAERLKGPTG